MKVIRGINGLRMAPRSSVVTIGVFDGVHAGHAKVIGRAVRRGRELGLKSVVITFDPHPAKALGTARGGGAPSLISLEHRIRLIGGMSPDYIVVAHFTAALGSMSPADFAAGVLASRAGAREVYIGSDFSFGKGASAGPRQLAALGKRLGFGVSVVPAVKMGARRVSSSHIRSLIREGKINRAARLLGRPVSVFGTVARGVRLARELGYPTANINPHHEVTPPSGVYAVIVNYGGRTYKGILNIGRRPTFYAPRDSEPAIEVHIFGFRKMIYGQDLEVSFVRKIRDEKRFRSARELIEQIRKDERIALND
jgi:riboflavin kinase/FMN adenylyltransferase